MSGYTPKPNTGSLFRNENKKTDKHPDYSGTALIDGVEYYIDGWINEVRSGERKGKKYFSFKFKEKSRQPPYASSEDDVSDDGDVPF